MPSGNTTTGSLGDSAETMIDSGRLVREHTGVFQRVLDKHTLEPNTGLSWEEISLAKLTAQLVTETTTLNNPQQMSDTLFSVTPLVVGVQTVITDRVYRRLSKKSTSLLGKLAQNAIQRKKDQDYLSTFSGFTTQLSGTGTTLASGIIGAAVSRITGNATEPSPEDGNIFTVLHPFQVKDLQDELTAGVGTYTLPTGMTQEIFKQGMAGIDRVSGSGVFRDGNITINATPDARGAVHHRMAVVLVQGHDLRTETTRKSNYGGGADEVILYDEYALGERSAGNWAFGVLTDATSPTT